MCVQLVDAGHTHPGCLPTSSKDRVCNKPSRSGQNSGRVVSSAFGQDVLETYCSLLALPQVLAVGPDSPTVFRIDGAQAGVYLRRCWASGAHPYDSTSPPWTQLKPLIAGDRFLCLEPAPGRPNSQHVTLDLLDMLRQLPKLGRRSAHGSQQGRASLEGVGGVLGADSGVPGANGARPASAASSSQAGPSSMHRASTPGDVLEEVDADDNQQGAAANPYGFIAQASTAAATAPANSTQRSAQDAVAAAEADVAALQALAYVPPAEGAAALQWGCFCFLGLGCPAVSSRCQGLCRSAVASDSRFPPNQARRVCPWRVLACCVVCACCRQRSPQDPALVAPEQAGPAGLCVG